MELVVVIVILAALAALVVPLISNTVGDSQQATTLASMRQLQDVITNRYWSEMDGVLRETDNSLVPGFPQANPLSDEGRTPHYPQLAFLFRSPSACPPFDAVSRRGWHGPYLQHSGGRYTITGSFTALYGLTGDPAVLDGWGNPIVLQRPTVESARLVSAGPDGILQTDVSVAMPTKTACGDDLVVFLSTPDVRLP